MRAVAPLTLGAGRYASLPGGDLTASLPGRRRPSRSPSSDATWDVIVPPASSHVASAGEVCDAALSSMQQSQMIALSNKT